MTPGQLVVVHGCLWGTVREPQGKTPDLGQYVWVEIGRRGYASCYDARNVAAIIPLDRRRLFARLKP